jgi:hypothetical protein
LDKGSKPEWRRREPVPCTRAWPARATRLQFRGPARSGLMRCGRSSGPAGRLPRRFGIVCPRWLSNHRRAELVDLMRQLHFIGRTLARLLQKETIPDGESAPGRTRASGPAEMKVWVVTHNRRDRVHTCVLRQKGLRCGASRNGLRWRLSLQFSEDHSRTGPKRPHQRSPNHRHLVTTMRSEKC